MSSRWINFFAVLILIAGTSSVQAQTLGECLMRQLRDRYAGNDPICDVFEEYLKCLLRIDVRNIGAHNIPVDLVQRNFDAELSKNGYSCELNVQKLIDEVLQEVTTQLPVNRPQEFDDAKDVGGCMDALRYQLHQRIDLACDFAQGHLKCVFRVNDLHKQDLSQREIQRLENRDENSLREIGILCDLDAHKAYRELRNTGSPQQPTVSQQPPTVSRQPPTVSQQPPNVSQQPTTISRQPPRSEFDDAKNVDECIDVYRHQVSQRADLVCDLAQECLKCVIRVSNLHKEGLTQQEIQNLENTSEGSLRDAGILCDLDAQKAYRELRNNSSQQPPTVSREPPTVSRQPPTVSRQPQTVSRQPPTVSRQPKTVSRQPPTVSRQPPSSRQSSGSLQASSGGSPAPLRDDSKNHSPTIVYSLTSLILALLVIKIF